MLNWQSNPPQEFVNTKFLLLLPSLVNTSILSYLVR